MSRLTERDEFGNADIIGIESEDLYANLELEQAHRLTSALNKLADFEDFVPRDASRWATPKRPVEVLRNNRTMQEYLRNECKHECVSMESYSTTQIRKQVLKEIDIAAMDRMKENPTTLDYPTALRDVFIEMLKKENLMP